MKNFQIKSSDIFHISAKNIDCGYSLERVPTIYVFEQKKNNVHPCKPQFNYIKVGFRGLKLYRHVFVMGMPKPSFWEKYYTQHACLAATRHRPQTRKKKGFANGVDPDEMAHTNLLWIYAVFLFTTVDSRYLDRAYLELPLISKWKSCPCLNLKI